MSYFDIKHTQLSCEASKMQTFAANLEEYIEQINSIKSILKMQGDGNLFNLENLNAAVTQMQAQSKSIQTMQKALSEIVTLYIDTESKISGNDMSGITLPVVAGGLTFLKGLGAGVDGDNNPLTGLKDETGNWGNIFGGLGESAVGIAKFLENGFSIVERNGKYFIKGGKEIRDLLKLPKSIKLSSILRAGEDSAIFKNIQKALKADKFFKFAKSAKMTNITKGISKAGTALAWISAALDVGDDLYDNIKNGAPTTKIIGDGIGDTVLAGGGVAVGSFGAAKGAAAGAAVGTAICPGIGTAVGGVVGGVGGAFASGWVYSKLTNMEIGGKSVEEWVDAGCTTAVNAVADVGSKVGKGISNACDAVGKGVSDACDAIGKGVSNACDSVADAVSSGFSGLCGLFG